MTWSALRGEQRQHAALPRGVGARVPAWMAQRRGVVEHDDRAGERDGSEVRGTEQRGRAEPRRTRGQHRLLPRVPGAVGEPAPAAAARRSGPAAAPAAGRSARAPSARRRPAPAARRPGRRWRSARSRAHHRGRRASHPRTCGARRAGAVSWCVWIADGMTRETPPAAASDRVRRDPATARDPAGEPRRAARPRPRRPRARSSRWCARAASCTGRGPIRRSAPTSSTTSSPAPGATTSSAWLPMLAEDGDIVGIFTVSQIVRGYFQSAYLGYYANARHAGKGLMGEAMALVLDHAFGPLVAAPARGEHPARQRAVDRAGARRRLPAGGLLAALPADRRPLARPRALRDHRRRARAEPRAAERLEQPELGGMRLGLRLALRLGSGSATTSGSGTTSSASSGSRLLGRGQREQLRDAARSRSAGCRASTACRAPRPGGRAGRAARSAARSGGSPRARAGA